MMRAGKLTFISWVAYITGAASAVAGATRVSGPSPALIIAGAIIAAAGLAGLWDGLKKSGLGGRALAVKSSAYAGGLLLFPGLFGMGLIGYNPRLLSLSFVLFIAGVIIIAACLIIKFFLNLDLN